MTIHAYQPIKSLSSFIKTYLIIESQDELVNRVLPDTSLVMAFRFKGQVSYLANGTTTDLPASLVTGLRKSGRLIKYSKDTGTVLVLFREAGANAFIKEPLHELFEDSVSLDKFAGYKNVPFIEEQLAGAKNNAQRIDLIEQFLLSKLNHYQTDGLILAALDKIHSVKGIVKIKDLTNSLYISQDAFEKRFRRVVGVAPKQFSYLIRMKSIVSSGIDKYSLAQVAFDAGYFDQPHFNKDFKLFTGLTPTDFLKSPVFW